MEGFLFPIGEGWLWPSEAQLKLLWPTLWEVTWEAYVGGVVKTQVLHKESHCFWKTDTLWGPKSTPLFSENENVSNNNALHSLNVSALQNHTSLGFKICPLQGIFLNNIKVLLFATFRAQEWWEHRGVKSYVKLNSKFSMQGKENYIVRITLQNSSNYP